MSMSFIPSTPFFWILELSLINGFKVETMLQLTSWVVSHSECYNQSQSAQVISRPCVFRVNRKYLIPIFVIVILYNIQRTKPSLTCCICRAIGFVDGNKKLHKQMSTLMLLPPVIKNHVSRTEVEIWRVASVMCRQLGMIVSTATYLPVLHLSPLSLNA